jgi:PAS domain-containing protein
MGEKIPSRISASIDSEPAPPAWFVDDRQELTDRLKVEDDLRIRMAALDMAVAALPHLVSIADNEEMKFRIIRRASAEFEKILRGEAVD